MPSRARRVHQPSLRRSADLILFSIWKLKSTQFCRARQPNLRDPSRGPRRRALKTVLVFALSGVAPGCQQLNPMVPQRASSSTVATQAETFNTSAIVASQKYDQAKTDLEKTRLRDEVVADRMLAYDVIFEDFAWNAWSADSRDCHTF